MTVIDTHVHLLVSKGAAPDWEEIAFTASAARMDELDVLCVTEHLDAQYYADLVNGIFLQGRLGGDVLSPGVVRLENGLILSCGAEIALRGGGDIGLHAAPETLLALQREKSAYRLGELLEALPEGDLSMTIVAHHYYWPRKTIVDLVDYAHRIDAIEMPAKDLDNAAMYEALAKALDLPLVGGSDAHTWIQVGSCRSESELADAATFGPGRLRALLAERAVRVRPLAAAAEKIRLSKIFRTRLEAQYARSAPG